MQTEIAIGADARSLRRWARRVMLPIVMAKILLLAAVVALVLASGSLLLPPTDVACRGGCFIGTEPPEPPQHPHDLLDLLDPLF